jgi:hypothetical protein
MGFLSSAAEKAFSRRRRAYVPDWFQPLSYLFGGIAALVLVIGVVTYDGTETAPTAQSSVPTIAPADSTPDSTGAASTSDPGTPAPSSTTGTAAGADTVAITGPDGQTLAAPADAVAVSQSAIRALFTGDFTGVPIYPGQPVPSVVRTWPNPRVEDTTVGEELADGTWRLSAVVDPDDAGPELPRQVTVFIASVEQSWAFLPG